MREIKFRGWNGKEMIDWEEIDYWQKVLEGSTQLIPLQFTGLKDKNGKEIYEGDIIQYYKFNTITKTEILSKFKVVFCEGSFMQESPENTIAEQFYEWDEVSVIGNIYENSEEIKGEKE